MKERDSLKTWTYVGELYQIGFEIGWHGVDWIGLAQDVEKWHAVVNAVMNLRVA